MDIYQLKRLPPSERAAILEGEKWTEEVYQRPLEDHEVADKERELAQACIKEAKILSEKKEAMDGFKERLKPVEKLIVECIEAVKTRQEDVTGPVYTISDFDNKMVHNLDPLGNVLNSRPMRPDERQYAIPLSKAI